VNTTALPCLFRDLLGVDFECLPETVRRLHLAPLPRCFRGHATVQAARSLGARWIARCTGLPLQSGTRPLAVTIEARDVGQRWTRDFPPRPMVSELTPHLGLLRERLGLATLFFRLRADPQRLTWELVGVRLLGVPLPLAPFRGCTAYETTSDGRYQFFVRAALPGVGLLVEYEGWLDLDEQHAH
jgi:hypothetical protein